MKNPELFRRQQAYSLLELMITIAIITILATLSLPALYPAEEKEAEQIFLQMAALISDARAAAISRHSYVVICPGAYGDACNNNWSAGVQVFVDHNQNRQPDLAEPFIAHKVWGVRLSTTQESLLGTLQWRVFGNQQSIRITPLGEMEHQNGSLTWCPPEGSLVSAHQMVLNSGGRIRLAADKNGDGVREDSQGRPLTC